MRPTFHPGDLLLVSRIPSNGWGPFRGETVVARDPEAPDSRYLKRVQGLPGERIGLCEGALFVDGHHPVEPYLGGLPASPGLESHAWELAEGEYFLLGDNRAHSTDSREFGPVARSMIVGRAWFRCWPLSRWGPTG